MPAARIFLDSNVLLYARDDVAGPREKSADDWLTALAASGAGRTNLQVLNEVMNVMLRKRQSVPAEQIFAEVDALAFFGADPITGRTVTSARSVRLRTSFAWWDCLLLASALELGCSHFLSEDLQDGQRIEDGTGRALTIVDPFAHTPADILPS
ncbi:MAG: PIN domain-containing protein [Rhizobiaceae bacterium]